VLACALRALCACTPPGGDDAPREKQRATVAPAPARSAPEAEPGSLPALQRARMDYLFDAMQRVAAAWPWMTHKEPCVLLLEADVQWGLNCPEAPAAAFARVAGSFRQQPVFMRAGGTFTAGGRALSTAEFLAQNPASAHIDDALARRTDLPAGRPWLVLGSLEALTAFHPAFRGASTEEWLSVALHEFLHTEALRLPSFAAELARINEKSIDPARLRALYEDDAVYRALVDREYGGLAAAAARPPDAARDRRALHEWRTYYDERRTLLSKRADGAGLIHDDSLFTYVEGVARYVESAFLVDAAQHPPRAIAGDPRFTGFTRWSGRGYAAMPNRQLDPQYYYAIGFHLSLLLERVDPTWKRRAPAHGNWLIGVAHEIDGAAR
jgi:hypothetical protein